MANQSELRREERLTELENRVAALEEKVFGKRTKPPAKKVTGRGNKLATDTIMEVPKNGEENKKSNE